MSTPADPNVRLDIGGWISGPCLLVPGDENELADMVAALSPADAKYALTWLALGGPASIDGQAVLKALAAVVRSHQS